MPTTINQLRKSADNHFVVYEHIRPDTGQVFYVGKGTKRRSANFSRPNNPHYNRIVSKIHKRGESIQIKIVAEALPECSAFILERMRIMMWRAAKIPIVNLTDGGEGVSNPPQEVRDKMRNGQLGRTASEDTRKKLSKAHKGRKHTEETRAKMSKAAKECQNRPETKAKMSAAFKGRPMPDSVKEKLFKGSRDYFSIPENRQKMSELKQKFWAVPENYERLKLINLGRKHTDETRAKVAAASRGRPQSEETRAKRSATVKAWFANPENNARAFGGRRGRGKPAGAT